MRTLDEGLRLKQQLIEEGVLLWREKQVLDSAAITTTIFPVVITWASDPYLLLKALFSFFFETTSGFSHMIVTIVQTGWSLTCTKYILDSLSHLYIAHSLRWLIYLG